jgi:hypothetical protein
MLVYFIVRCIPLRLVVEYRLSRRWIVSVDSLVGGVDSLVGGVNKNGWWCTKIASLQ